MKNVHRAWIAVVILSTAVVVAACSPDHRDMADDDGDDAPPPPAADAGTPDASETGFIDASPNVPDSSIPSELDGVVYGHSSSTLYKVDPDSFAVTTVADFTWPAGTSDTMTDIAVDKDGHMMGVSFTKIYSVDPETAVCTFLGNLDHQFNGLSFVPAAEGDPTTDERLVGTTLDGSVWKINPATGATTQVGSYGNAGGTTWTSSGDIVYVEGFGIVATVKGSGLGHDFLAFIDPTDFHATVMGDLGVGTGFSDIWGLGFWKGKVFGFSGAGQMLLIDPATGAGSLLTGAQSVIWWGAGVTTAAPIVD